MSNALYNKIKTIEGSRKDLKNVLNSKGLDTTNVEALGSLVGMVGQLERPNYFTPEEEIWEGITRKEAPTNYYKGDDDWKDLIDLEEIMENDTENYPKKAILLIRVSDNPESTTTLTNATQVLQQLPSSIAIWGAIRCKFSDGNSITNISSGTTTHTWDETEDIVASNGERFRYIITYATASETANIYYMPTFISFEAIYISDGTFANVSPNGSSIVLYTNEQYQYKRSIMTPKYLELSENASITNLNFNTQPGGSTLSVYESRYKTIILNGNVTTISGTIFGEDLEFLKYNGTTKCSFTLRSINNENINTYVYLKNCNVLSCAESDNMDIYVDDITAIGTNTQNHNINYSLHTTTNTSIASNAFSSSCLNVKVDLGNVGSVGTSAFYKFKDNKLKIGLINGDIGSLAFYDSCLSQDIVVGSGCTYIGTNTTGTGCYAPFGLCNVTKLDLSNSSITIIPRGVFEVTKPTPTGNQYYPYNGLLNESHIKYIILPERLKTIDENAFAWCEELEQIDFGSEITTVGNAAFYNCINIRSISLPNSIASIGDNLFYGCKNLQTVKLPDNITTLPAALFKSCKSLINVALPSRVAALGNNIFEGCTSLEHIVLPSGIAIIPSRCFDGCVNLLDISCPEGDIHILQDYAFANCEKLEEIPDIHNVTTLGVGVFMNCKKLQIKCPSDTTAMDANCFAGNNDFVDFSEFNSSNITTISLRGSLWTYENILKFLYKLPDRTSKTRYTLKLGPSFSRMMWSGGSDQGDIYAYTIQTNTNWLQYETSIYPSYSGKYILDNGTGLEWSDSSTEGAVTVANYVAGKNWALV